MLQQFRSPDDIAIYYAASKTIALVSFVYFAVSAAVAHRFSEYHVTGDRERLAEFLAEFDPLDVLGVGCRNRRDPAAWASRC